MATTDLLEPELLYKSQLKDQHSDGVNAYFDNLTKQSGVDIESNRVSVKEYKHALTKLESAKKILKKAKVLKGFIIVLLSLSALASTVCALFFGFAKNKILEMIISIVVGVILITTCIILLCTVVRKKVKTAEEKINKWESIAKEKKAVCESQMAPLNDLFEDNIPQSIMQKTTPLLKLDRYFSISKMEQLINNYGYCPLKGKDLSILAIQSGSILGNPWTVIKKLNKQHYIHRYHGELTIFYTETVSDGKGGRYTVTRSQTLHAYLDKPAVKFYDDVTLIYGNDAAPNLTFTRTPSNINSFNSEDKIDKWVRRHEKDLYKRAKKITEKGGNYTPLGNPEFELFFGGLDRNNEVEYRLLFTPLGQKSMLQLLKSKVGYGDDFTFIKNKKINKISANHAQNGSLFITAESFTGYDYDEMKNRFSVLNNEYFRSLYFTLAPLLCIPLYQQHKSKEYIYQGTLQSNYSSYEHEIAANHIGAKQFAHEDTKTKTILSTQFVGKIGNSDKVKVTAYSFDTKKHIEYVRVYGNDGHYHSVPVEWIEYIPLEKEGYFAMADTSIQTFRDFNNKLDDEKYGKFLANNVEGNRMIFDRGLISFPIKDKDINVDVNTLKEMIKK